MFETTVISRVYIESEIMLLDNAFKIQLKYSFVYIIREINLETHTHIEALTTWN